MFFIVFLFFAYFLPVEPKNQSDYGRETFITPNHVTIKKIKFEFQIVEKERFWSKSPPCMGGRWVWVRRGGGSSGGAEGCR